jgi:hypothetical protein
VEREIKASKDNKIRQVINEELSLRPSLVDLSSLFFKMEKWSILKTLMR